MKYHLAIDLGASSGVMMLLSIPNGHLNLEEIHRFPNSYIRDPHTGYDIWQVPQIWSEIKKGLEKCQSQGKKPQSIGVDSWGVDFILLDDEKKSIGPCVSYRDHRTVEKDTILSNRISEEELYQRSGIQKQIFNTIYQFIAVKCDEQTLLDKARYFLMLPDYINFLLTGKITNEYTNATTTSLVNAASAAWDEGLLELIGIPPELFSPLIRPGEYLGELRAELVSEIGFGASVYAVASHDTASAFLAAPIKEAGELVLSSGTWSLLGREISEAILSEKSRIAGFTNEGGWDGSYRYLQNIMGLWILQEVCRTLNTKDRYALLFPDVKGVRWDYARIEKSASQSTDYEGRINVYHPRYLVPRNRLDEILNDLAEQSVRLPKTVGQVFYGIYASLANFYATSIATIDRITDARSRVLHVLGGGSQDQRLNRLTAASTHLTLTTGPVEASAIGNGLIQFIASGELSNLSEGRELIRASCEIKEVRNGND